jgi:hypothetical protein
MSGRDTRLLQESHVLHSGCPLSFKYIFFHSCYSLAIIWGLLYRENKEKILQPKLFYHLCLWVTKGYYSYCLWISWKCSTWRMISQSLPLHTVICLHVSYDNLLKFSYSSMQLSFCLWRTSRFFLKRSHLFIYKSSLLDSYVLIWCPSRWPWVPAFLLSLLGFLSESLNVWLCYGGALVLDKGGCGSSYWIYDSS